jgi:arsenical pump membrane protein
MFVLILSLSRYGVTQSIAEALSGINSVYGYGVGSFLASNVINNIPMSVLFSTVIESAGTAEQIRALYASVIGSNLGALLTPIGALAGIMWTMILKSRDVKFGYTDFVKYVGAVSVPATAISLLILNFVI